MSNLPTIRIFVRCPNPKWKWEDNGLADNANEEAYHINYETDAEVLTLHLKTQKMRIRYKKPDGKVDTINIPIDSFFYKYSIELK